MMSISTKKLILLFLLIPLLTAESCNGTGCLPTCKEQKNKKNKKNGKQVTGQKHPFIRTPSSNNVEPKREVEPGEKPSTQPESNHDDSVSNETNGAQNGSEQPTNIDNSTNEKASVIKQPCKTETPKKQGGVIAWFKKKFIGEKANSGQPKDNNETTIYENIVDDMQSKTI